MSMSNHSAHHTCAPPMDKPPMKIHAGFDKKTGTLVAVTPSGSRVVMAATEAAAAQKIPGAMETFVSALAGCTMHEILEVMILQDHQSIEKVEAEVTGIRRPAPPTLFDTLHVTFTLTGDIEDAYARGVISDIMTRRCPVAATFGRASYLTWDHVIVPPAA